MKFKKLFIILSLILLLIISYFIYYKITEKKVEAFIDSNFLFIFQSRDVFTLYKELNASRLLDTVFYEPSLKEIYKVLVDTKAQMSRSKQFFLNIINFPGTFVLNQEKKSLLLFDTGIKTPLLKITSFALHNFFSDSEKFLISIEKYNSITINKITLLKNRQSYYFSQVNNILMFSADKGLLYHTLDNYLHNNNLLKNENYLQVRAQLETGKLLRIFFNSHTILEETKNNNPELYKSLKSLSILSIAGADFDIGETDIKINSFLSTGIQDDISLKLFQSFPHRINSVNILPQKTSYFTTITFDNFQDVWNYFLRILVITDQKEKEKELIKQKNQFESIMGHSLEDFIFSWLDNEITIASFDGFKDPVILLSLKNQKKIKEVLGQLQEKNILKNVSSDFYNQTEIQQLKLSSFFEFLIRIFSPDFGLPYYSLYPDFIILSRDIESIKFFIDSYKMDNILAFKETTKKIYSHINKANVLSYWDIEKDSSKILEANNLFTKIIRNYNYGMAGMEFIDKGIKSKIILTEPKNTNLKLMAGWPINLNSTLWSAPLSYNINNNNLEEIILGTENGKVYAFNIFGETIINWPVKLEGNLKTSPFIFFHPDKKKTYIGAISEQGQIFIWDKEGYLLPNFPISLEGDIEKNPILTDLNNDSKIDILVANNNGKIFAVNLSGQSLPGFPIEIEKGVEPDIQLIKRTERDREILCSSHSFNGEIFLINSTGEINKEKMLVTGTLNISEPVIIYEENNDFSIYLITGNGKLFVWNKNFELKSSFPIEWNQKFVNAPVIDDINNDSHREILLISAKGKLLTLNLNGHLLSEVDLNFKPIENEKILLRDINQDNLKEIFIPGTDGFIHVFDITGHLLFKINGSFTPTIKDLDQDGRLEMITASDSGSVYLYKLP